MRLCYPQGHHYFGVIAISDLRKIPDGFLGEDDFVCMMCGNETYAGGLWAGFGRNIIVCDDTCAQKLLLLALDTISSVGDSMPYAEWMKFADETYDRWEQARSVQEGNREGFNLTMEAVL